MKYGTPEYQAHQDQRFNEQQLKVQKGFYIAIALFIVAIALPLLALAGVLKPVQESLGTWFQRSGSLTVLFAAMAEYSIVKLYAILWPSGIAIDRQKELQDLYVFIIADLL